jgi:site-specific recombinase XerD
MSEIEISKSRKPNEIIAALPADQNPALVYLATLRPTGRRTMREALDIIAGIAGNGKTNLLTFPWHSLRYQHTAAIRQALAEKYSPATLNKMLSALRQVLKEAWQLGQMTAEDYRRAANLKSAKAQTLPRGRALKNRELKALLNSCAKDASPAGVRDAAMLAVLYSAGLRRSELVALKLADYSIEESSLIVKDGKGGKDRVCYLNQKAAETLNTWLKLRGSEPGGLFCPVNKGKKIVLRSMTDQAIRKTLIKRAVEAGVDKFSPHDLRRTFISDLLDAGADIATVQKLAGHANVQTTTRYDRRGETAKQKAVALLNFPTPDE